MVLAILHKQLGKSLETVLKPVDVFQKQIMRIMIFSRRNCRAHTKPLFKSLTVLKLESLCTFETAKVMHQLCNNLTPKTNANDYCKINRVYSCTGLPYRPYF